MLQPISKVQFRRCSQEHIQLSVNKREHPPGAYASKWTKEPTIIGIIQTYAITTCIQTLLLHQRHPGWCSTTPSELGCGSSLGVQSYRATWTTITNHIMQINTQCPCNNDVNGLLGHKALDLLYTSPQYISSRLRGHSSHTQVPIWQIPNEMQ